MKTNLVCTTHYALKGLSSVIQSQTQFVCVTDSKHVMLPTGELHVMNVDAHDGRSSYQCRTLHRLTGRTQESVTAGRIVIAGKSPLLSLQHVIRLLGLHCFDQTLPGRRPQQFPLLSSHVHN
jgi:hypothetical protein